MTAKERNEREIQRLEYALREQAKEIFKEVFNETYMCCLCADCQSRLDDLKKKFLCEVTK